MGPKDSEKIYLDPIEELDEALEYTWRTLCDYYDAGAELPDLPSLFNGADVASPQQAAEIVITNMLIDVVGSISRFSPWYTKPARVFGLNAIRDVKTKCIRWVLAPEAMLKWEDLIEHLTASVQNNSGLIQAMLYVENLMGAEPPQDECVPAKCSCLPPHSIKVNKSVLEKMDIFCNVCKQPFT